MAFHARAYAVTALALVLIGGCTPQQAGPGTTEPLLDQMLRTHTLVVGYAGYPPYLVEDAATGAVSGYSVDILNAILAPLSVQPTWQRTTWDAMKQDLLTKKIDVMIEPIFFTIPRVAELGFTRPYAYFGYAIPVVRKNEARFSAITDLNRSDVTIAVTQGVTDQDYAAANLPLATVRSIPGNDISLTLTEVAAGRVDAALADVPSALAFVRAHDNVKALFLDAPPATTPASFATRREETSFISFLNSALLYLESAGLFEQLEARYSLPSFRERREWVFGRGLQR